VLTHQEKKEEKEKNSFSMATPSKQSDVSLYRDNPSIHTSSDEKWWNISTGEKKRFYLAEQAAKRKRRRETKVDDVQQSVQQSVEERELQKALECLKQHQSRFLEEKRIAKVTTEIQKLRIRLFDLNKRLKHLLEMHPKNVYPDLLIEAKNLENQIRKKIERLEGPLVMAKEYRQCYQFLSGKKKKVHAPPTIKTYMH
jgi:hypothetical protein